VSGPAPHVIVVFGGNGDLARRKLIPALWRLHTQALMPSDWRVVGTSRASFDTADFQAFAAEAITEFCEGPPTGDAWDVFRDRLSYVAGAFSQGATDALVAAVAVAERAMGGEAQRLHYLAIPPAAFGSVTEGLAAAGLTARSRVVYEKPFGWDLDSFRQLHALTHRVLRPEQILTIDHYLAKETLQNVLALRFANGMFEPVWNRNHIDHVQIDVPEELGVGNRAPFYDVTGALRDMVVTHLFQALGVVAMEPPHSFGAKPLLDEKAKVFESMLPLRADDLVRGQYRGYRATAGVADDSTAETFVAARVEVDNWRWAGVPFFLRTGKRMATSRQSVTLAFREPPHRLFPDLPRDGIANDYLTMELGREEGITLSFLAKRPGATITLAPAAMTFRYGSSFGGGGIGPYERLIYDALMGDRTLFTRADGIERTWELVADVLANPPSLHSYDQGSWGPAAAGELIGRRRWYLPERDLEVENAARSSGATDSR
jgi:glucose-6-phosphate 1-dehydrogenase